MTELTQARLKELFDYDPETGVVTRRRSTTKSPAGSPVGSKVGAGYLGTFVDGRRQLIHRIVWVYIHGVWPPHDIDHINGVKADNRLANLRLATRSENQHNMRDRKNNTSGFVGVRRSDSASAWSARITVEGREIHIGCFSTAELASAAYQAAKLIHHPTAPQK